MAVPHAMCGELAQGPQVHRPTAGPGFRRDPPRVRQRPHPPPECAGPTPLARRRDRRTRRTATHVDEGGGHRKSRRPRLQARPLPRGPAWQRSVVRPPTMLNTFRAAMRTTIARGKVQPVTRTSSGDLSANVNAMSGSRIVSGSRSSQAPEPEATSHPSLRGLMFVPSRLRGSSRSRRAHIPSAWSRRVPPELPATHPRDSLPEHESRCSRLHSSAPAVPAAR